MRKQKEMVESFQMMHRDYIKNFINCLTKIETDFEESRKMDETCTRERCKEIELSLDEMAKNLYSISEPRWVADDYSRTLRNMRRRLHDLYAKYHGTCSLTTH